MAAAAAAVDQILQASAGMTRWMPLRWGEAEAKARCSPGACVPLLSLCPSHPTAAKQSARKQEPEGEGGDPRAEHPMLRGGALSCKEGSARAAQAAAGIDSNRNFETTVAMLLEHGHPCTPQGPGLSWR